jgi:glutamine amidotransferase
MIGLVNYGSGNYSSVKNALEFLNLPVKEVITGSDFKECTHIILPGVGAFASAMQKLEKMQLIDTLNHEIMHNKKPFLGICVGMQILATIGKEFTDYPGLDWIQGTVEQIDISKSGLRLPHIGWNELEIVNEKCPLFTGLPPDPIYYFVHSFNFVPTASSFIAALCDYGENITAVLQSDNIYGVQFHPEKSQHDGLKLLKNFSEL